MAVTLTLHILLSLAFAYCLFSFLEYAVHRFAMHKMRLANRYGVSFLQRLCANHMALHHKRDYRHKDHAKDDRIRDVSLAGFVPAMVVILLLALFDPLAARISLGFGVAYGILWWVVHNEMHRSEGRFFSGTAVYRYLERRHQLHHLHPGTNYGVILPLWDFLLRTSCTPEIQRAAAARQGSGKEESSPDGPVK